MRPLAAPGCQFTREGWGNRNRREMHQTAKGRQWYFGMKAHMGVDSRHPVYELSLLRSR